MIGLTGITLVLANELSDFLSELQIYRFNLQLNILVIRNVTMLRITILIKRLLHILL